MNDNPVGDSGQIAILLMLPLLVLAVAAAILLGVGLGEVRIATSNSAQIEAMTIAESGTEKVLARLSSDPYWEYWPKGWEKSFSQVPLGSGYIAQVNIVPSGNSLTVKAEGKKESSGGRVACRGIKVGLRWQLPSVDGVGATNLLERYPDVKPDFSDLCQRAAYTFYGPTEISPTHITGKSGLIFVNGDCRLEGLGTYTGHIAIISTGKLEVEGQCQPANSGSGLVLVAKQGIHLLPSVVEAVLVTEGQVVAEAGAKFTGAAFASSFVGDVESNMVFSAKLLSETMRLLPGAGFQVESWQEEYPVF